jgi:hypothetical protein
MNVLIQVFAGVLIFGVPGWLAVLYFGGRARDRQLRERYDDPAHRWQDQKNLWDDLDS